MSKIYESLNTRKLGRLNLLIWIIVIVFYICISLYGASGLRGTDDYWYVADVESLITGNGPYSNNVYPVSIINEDASLPRPFVHNTLNVYLAAVPALIFGAYRGWIVLNILSGLITSYIIYRIVIKFTKPGWAALMACTYLLLPVTLIQTVKPMAEASIAPLVALLLFVYTLDSNKFSKWAALQFIAGLLLFCRPSFLPLILIIPFVYLVKNWNLKFKVAAGIIGLFLIGVSFMGFNRILFEPNVSYSNLKIVNSGVPNKSDNMNIFLNLYPEAITVHNTINNLKAKASEGLRIQYLSGKAQMIRYYLPFNLAGLVAVVMLFISKKQKVRELAMAAIFFYLLHLLTVVVFQNQERYMLVAMPPMLAALGVAISGLGEFTRSRRGILIVFIILVLGFIPLNYSFAKDYRQSITVAKRVQNELGHLLESTIPKKDSVMIEAENPSHYLLEGYLLRPRLALMVLDNYKMEDYKVLINRIDAKWLICQHNSPIIKKLGMIEAKEVKKLPWPYENFRLYELTR